MSCGTISELPSGVVHLIFTFKKALCAIERLGSTPTTYSSLRENIDWCSEVSPLILRHSSHVTYDVAVRDKELTGDAWQWLEQLKLRGLTVQEMGLSKLPASLQESSCRLRQLESLAIETSEDEHLSNALPHLASLKHLEVSLQGAGTSFPRLGDRRLKSIVVNCSNTASLYTLTSLCKADEVTVTAAGDVVWNTNIQNGLGGFPHPSALLEVANGRFTGGSDFASLRLLVPSGFHHMFGSMGLSQAITSSGTLNCYALALAAQLAELPPTRLTLQAPQSIRLQDPSGPLPASSLNFSHTLPRSAAVWQAVWEAAAHYSGLELSYELHSSGGAQTGEEGAGGEAAALIRATVHKRSPPVHWPLQQPKEEVVSGGEGSVAADAVNSMGELGPQQGREGQKGEVVERSRRVERMGQVLGVVTGAALVALGLMLMEQCGSRRMKQRRGGDGSGRGPQ